MRSRRVHIVMSAALLTTPAAFAWVPSVAATARWRRSPAKYPMSSSDDDNHNVVSFDSLMDMDVVLFSRNSKNEKQLELGAIQEDGTLAPLSAWSEDAAFGNSVEFLVDEEDRFPGLQREDVQIQTLLSEDVVSYGSRQVGGGKGPGNPHGEESELLYYVDKGFLENYAKNDQLQIVIKPELEILW